MNDGVPGHHATGRLPGTDIRVPFSRAELQPQTIRSVLKALHSGHLTGGGHYTQQCHSILAALMPHGRPFLTGSGTAALEMAALILRLMPGDEVIMPSWTFPSTANAFALRGAVPVFVDIDRDTLNIDPLRAHEALTPRTRAICCVHYAGMACDMSALLHLCRTHGLALIEDAAQAYGACWRDRPLGGIGDLGAFSFHGTKNVSSGEGGALMVNRADLVSFAEISWEKGTDRLRFQRGETPGYKWQDLGSSFLPSDLTAALLATQLACADELNARRVEAWQRYHAMLLASPALEHLHLPMVPPEATPNGHIYAVRTRSGAQRDRLVAGMVAEGLDVRSHYKPLHSAPAGRRYGRVSGPMGTTVEVAASLLRLPIDASITEAEQEMVVEALIRLLRENHGAAPPNRASGRQ